MSLIFSWFSKIYNLCELAEKDDTTWFIDTCEISERALLFVKSSLNKKEEE